MNKNYLLTLAFLFVFSGVSAQIYNQCSNFRLNVDLPNTQLCKGTSGSFSLDIEEIRDGSGPDLPETMITRTWYKRSSTSQSWSVISNHRSNSLYYTSSNSVYFRVKIEVTGCETKNVYKSVIYSDKVGFSVNNVTICPNANPSDNISMSVTGNSGLTCKWYRKNGSNGTMQYIQTSNTLVRQVEDFTIIPYETHYYVKVSKSGYCNSRYTKINIDRPTVPELRFQNLPLDYCRPYTSFNFNNYVSHIGGDFYINGIPISSSSADLRSFGSGEHTLSYTYTFSVGQCIVPETVTSRITIYDISPGSIIGNQSICTNTTPNLITNSSSASNYLSDISYQWQKRVRNTNGTYGDWYNISNTDNADYQSGKLTRSAQFRRIAKSCGVERSSNLVTITVGDPGSVGNKTYDRCGPGYVNMYISVPTCYNTIRWYKTNSVDEAHFRQSNSYNPNLSSDTVYYVAAYNSSTGVESDRSLVSVTIDSPVEVSAGNDLVGYMFEGEINLANTGESPINGRFEGGGVYNNTFRADWVGPGFHRIRYVYGECSTLSYKNIEVRSNPTITLKGSRDLIWGSIPRLKVPEGFANYQWYNNNKPISGATSNFIEVRNPGNYSVKIISTSGAHLTLGPEEITKSSTNQNENYIHVIDYKIKDKTGNNIASIEDLNETFTYFDGLGREIQKVRTQASPNKNDLIIPTAYDGLGRKGQEFLPYSIDKKNGHIDYDALKLNGNQYQQSSHFNFYNNYNSDLIAQSEYAFVRNIYENSPLNRKIAQISPGENWHRNNRAVTTEYYINEQYDVRQFETEGEELVLKSFVEAGELEKIISTDENGNKSMVFNDAFGKTILKRNLNGNKDHDTYYVYDYRDNLRYVIPPEVIERLNSNSGTFPNDLLSQFVFQYNYDGRNRMIWKKVPGAEPVNMIYDDRDRLVLTQDGEQAKDNLFSFTKYDALNRPIMTGEMEINSSIPNLRDLLSGDDWLRNYAAYETLEGDKYGYTSNSLPKNLDLDDIHTVTYYDNYAFRNEISLDGVEYDYESRGMKNAFEQTGFVKGLVTGSLTRVLGTNEMLASVNYYDERYNLLQSINDQLEGNSVVSRMAYDFSGKLIFSETNSNIVNEDLKVSERFEYDHADRLKNTYHTVANPIVWTDLVGVEKDGNDIIKTASNGYGNAGVASSKIIPAGANGYVEYTVKTDGRILFGLSEVNTSAHYNTIDYALFSYYQKGWFNTYEKGASKGISSRRGGVQLGDVLRVERFNGLIYYKKNGEVVHISETPSESKLVADFALHNTGDRIHDAMFSVSGEKLMVSNKYNELGELVNKKLDLFSGAGAKYEYSITEPVKWRGLNGLELYTQYNNNILRHIGNDGYDNSGAYSDQKLNVNENGRYSVSINSSGRYLFGLNDAPSNNGYKDMDYALYVANNGQLYIYENGSKKTNAGLAYYGGGDVVSIEKLDSKIYYKHNEKVIYISTKKVNNVLYPDVTTYNYGDRVFDAMFTISGNSHDYPKEYAENENLVVTNIYEEAPSAYAQSIDYRYNIRGWLSRINNSSLIEDNSNEKPDLFGMELGYTDDIDLGYYYNKQFNGNISAINWSSRRNDLTAENKMISSAYTYTYDNLNRIISANYYMKIQGYNDYYDNSLKYQLRINEYDRNGNIKQLQRRDANGSLMDDLTYNYNNSGNQLNFVSDAGDVEKGFKDGNTSGDDYTYDYNGNMTTDANKEISSISYNHLNLPEEVSFENGNKIHYIYDASGIKLRQEVYENNVLKKATDYIGSLIFENDTLQFIQTAEGRVVPKTVDGADKNEYQYHLKDHLGNVRSTFAVRDDEYATTFETLENPYFDNYEQITTLSNQYKRSGNYCHRLAGGGNEVIGLMKSLYVSKGDKVSAEVYGKYLDAQFKEDGINGAALVNALVSMLGGGTLTGEGTVIENNLNTDFISAAMADGSDEESPKAYLNYIMLDKNFNYVNSGFERLTASAADPGDGSGTHQKLSFEEIAIEEDGYLMVFLSNESQQTVEVFWDDFRVDHHYNAVLQADDYYPFGLTFNSYQRSYSKANNYKYNGFEEQVEWGVYDYQARYYDAALGRFLNVDPAADLMRRHSPYNYAFDNPIRFIDPDGMMPSDVVGNEDCCPGTQSPQSAFNQALGKLESLFNTVVENVEDVLESLSPEKIEIEKEGSTEKATVDHDGLATAKEGDQADNAPETSGKVETLEETMPVEGVPPSETDRANTLWDLFIDPFIEIVDPSTPTANPGDSAKYWDGRYGRYRIGETVGTDGNVNNYRSRDFRNKEDSAKYDLK